ncbi:UNVERIFIED_CONTAM: DNA-binding protein DDB [Sesamum radiatum]|uniref:DNA-binding protein DDB n=1 Tax=Sesamum radiatum TaxID=300843 RepID=A0AAW2K2Q3_SESRA
MQELMAQRGMVVTGSFFLLSFCFFIWLIVLDGSCRVVVKVLNSRKPRRKLKVARIALVKPDKARGVEDVILRAAQMGQIAEKVSEERLISLLEQINTQTTKETKVTIKRRQSVLDDE